MGWKTEKKGGGREQDDKRRKEKKKSGEKTQIKGQEKREGGRVEEEEG